MNNDLTLATITFKKAYDTKDESLRQSVARGINTPDRLIIKSQEYVDSKTKVPGNRYTIRFDRVDIDANLQEIVSSAYTVIAIPKTATQTAINSVIAELQAGVADANLITNVLNNEK